jgi:Na+-transporting NADH:ubiquinone oxidoreductase subunit C
MIAVTVVFTFLLAYINEVTQSVIDEQEALRVEKSILYVFGVDVSDLEDDTIHEKFIEIIEISDKEGEKYYIYKPDNKVMGYAVEISGKGLWGTITGHIGFSPDHETVLGVNFVSHSETPGLGGRIDEVDYKNQFRNLSLPEDEVFFVNNKDTGGNVDAITGATLTSKAVINIYNNRLPEILEQARKVGYYEGN